jgi:hypothetical protein
MLEMLKRLPWERTPDGFAAFPEGREHDDRSASLRPMTATGGWAWSIRCGLAAFSGIASSSQEASNAANGAWSNAVAVDQELQVRARRDAELLALIDQVTVEADPDVASVFGLKDADKNKLSWMMDQVRHRTRTPGLNKLIEALSSELYKFRTEERR